MNKETINSKINSNLNTKLIEIIDFSNQHKNHYDNGARGDISHITILIVSKDLKACPKLKESERS